MKQWDTMKVVWSPVDLITTGKDGVKNKKSPPAPKTVIKQYNSSGNATNFF